MNPFPKSEDVLTGLYIKWHWAFAMLLFGCAIGAIGILFAFDIWAGFIRTVKCP